MCWWQCTGGKLLVHLSPGLSLAPSSTHGTAAMQIQPTQTGPSQKSTQNTQTSSGRMSLCELIKVLLTHGKSNVCQELQTPQEVHLNDQQTIST